MATRQYVTVASNDRVHREHEVNHMAAAHAVHAANPPPAHSSTQHAWLHRLSWWLAASLASAFLVLAAVVGFLWFLWSQPDGLHVNATWRNIVFSDMMIKSITISSLVIRTAVSAQAG